MSMRVLATCTLSLTVQVWASSPVLSQPEALLAFPSKSKSWLEAVVSADPARKLLLWVLGHPKAPPSQLGSREPPKPNASCPDSSYFIDWGSSGMKVFRVHHGAEALAEEDAVPGSLKEMKLTRMGTWTSDQELRSTLDNLAQGLRGPEGPPMAMLATAGLRKEPEAARRIWHSVRDWADAHKSYFARCGHETGNEDCRTQSGAEEAALAMRAALQLRPLREGQRLGFADAGGASLQVGLQGPEVEDCRKDLGALDLQFDQRLDVTEVAGRKALVLSFLSIANRTCAIGEICDYAVGGLDQMRAKFDQFLMYNGVHGNPCLSEHSMLSNEPACSFFGSDSCVLDRFGGKISHLPPLQIGGKVPLPVWNTSAEHRKAACKQHIGRFMAQDLILSRWRKSQSCTSLAGNISHWMLLSSYAREMQLGADVNVRQPFRNVQEAARSLNWATPEEVERGEEGVMLSSMLLVHFLEVLGVASSAELQAVHTSWSEEAMRERGLARGWAKRCPEP